MRWLLRSRASVRGRLTLWNTITFAIVLVALGIGFRFLARNYLLSALDREIGAHAKRMQETHTVKRLMLSNNVTSSNLTMRIVGAGNEPPPNITTPRHTESVRVEVMRNVGEEMGDSSGQYQYRPFDLDGKPLSMAPPSLLTPIGMVSGGGNVVLITPQPEQYKPWDLAALNRSMMGAELFSNVDSKGGPFRIMSLPLRDGDKIIGAAQIATSLTPVHRDISGLTRALILLLAPALLIAGIAGVFLTDRALRPVKALTCAAARIQADQLQQRLPECGADEFAELAATFNKALGRVELAFLERERMLEQLKRFTGDASHELRTPLTTIKANTGVALTDESPSKEHVHALRQIDRAADRMTHLVDDLLMLARSDSGEQPRERLKVSLHSAMQEAVDLLPTHAPGAAIEVRGGEDLVVTGDPEQLIRLFRNLFENALRYTAPDGSIVANASRSGTNIRVTVVDSGAGIAPEHLAHLGERFYRADSGRDRRQGGAGLGLAICRSIVKQHGGVMNIESVIGVGTTITILLPG